MLGLFDSGLGGLTVLRRLREELPQADILYFADQAHVPYGDRSPEELMGLLRGNVAWLDRHGVDAIVMACNTSCSIGNSHGWPPSRARIFDLIDAAVQSVREGEYRHIGVVATTATVRTGAYARAIVRALAHARVTEIAAPALVPLIESQAATLEQVDNAVAAVCARLPADLDALVYGCTHYPLIDASFARCLDEAVARIDPAIVQARNVARAACEGGGGTTRYVTSGDLDAFRAQLRAAGLSFDEAESVGLSLEAVEPAD